MVKYGVYLQSHLVSEWSDAYIRYKQCKKVLKKWQAVYQKMSLPDLLQWKLRMPSEDQLRAKVKAALHTNHAPIPNVETTQHNKTKKKRPKSDEMRPNSKNSKAKHADRQSALRTVDMEKKDEEIRIQFLRADSPEEKVPQGQAQQQQQSQSDSNTNREPAEVRSQHQYESETAGRAGHDKEKDKNSANEEGSESDDEPIAVADKELALSPVYHEAQRKRHEKMLQIAKTALNQSSAPITVRSLAADDDDDAKLVTIVVPTGPSHASTRYNSNTVSAPPGVSSAPGQVATPAAGPVAANANPSQSLTEYSLTTPSPAPAALSPAPLLPTESSFNSTGVGAGVNGNVAAAAHAVPTFLDFLPSDLVHLNEYEAQFFQILADDLKRINKFFQLQEEFFGGKLYVLKNQLLQCARRKHDDRLAENDEDNGEEEQNKHKKRSPKTAKGERGVKSAVVPLRKAVNEYERKIGHVNKNQTLQRRNTVDSTHTNANANGPAKAAASAKGNVGAGMREVLPGAIEVLRPSVLNMLEKNLRELYRGLQLLRNYRILNYTGFVKIMKKYAKKSPVFPQMANIVVTLVERAHFMSSRLLDRFLGQTEDLYIDYFASGDRKRGMDKLRGQLSAKPISALNTYIAGVFSGFALAALILLGFLVQYVVSNGLSTSSLIASLPVFRSFFLQSLYLWLLSTVFFLCSYFHINHSFIFQSNPATELSHITFYEIAAVYTLAWFLCFDYFLYVFAAWEDATQRGSYNPGWIHLSLYCAVFAVLFFPFNFFFKATRTYLLRTLMRVIFLAPFMQSTFTELFAGDQLCSLINVLVDMSYSMCFYVSGSFLTNDSSYCKTAVNGQAIWCVAALPYVWRFVQCIRRYHDIGQRLQLFNAVKYLLSVHVTIFNLLFTFYGGPVLESFWIFFAIITSLYAAFWDIKYDWGLLEKYTFIQTQPVSSSNPIPSSNLVKTKASWLDGILRTRRFIHYPWVYFYAMISDVLLRGVWILTISPGVFGISIEKDYFTIIVTAAEIFRRNQWNFFRLENEHLNNVEHFRAVNIVPLNIPLQSVVGSESMDLTLTRHGKSQQVSGITHPKILREKSLSVHPNAKKPSDRNDTEESYGPPVVHDQSENELEQTAGIHERRSIEPNRIVMEQIDSEQTHSRTNAAPPVVTDFESSVPNPPKAAKPNNAAVDAGGGNVSDSEGDEVEDEVDDGDARGSGGETDAELRMYADRMESVRKRLTNPSSVSLHGRSLERQSSVDEEEIDRRKRIQEMEMEVKMRMHI